MNYYFIYNEVEDPELLFLLSFYTPINAANNPLRTNFSSII